MKIFLILLAVGTVSFAGLGLAVCIKVLYPQMKSLESLERHRIDDNLYDINWYNRLEKHEFALKSKYGYDLHMTYIKNAVPTEHTIIICHGVTMRTEGVIKYLDMFIKNGYNALFIDHRAHGRSGGKNVGYGYYERHDLAKAIQWTKNKHTGKVGLIGESMGASIAMQTLLVASVDFVIADCGYSDFAEEVKHQLRSMKSVPLYPTYQFTRFFIWLLGGYDVAKVSAVEAVRASDVPILLIHGDKDEYVPYYMMDIIYRNIKSQRKMKYIAVGSEHAFAYQDNPIKYQKQVVAFLQKYSLYVA